jgi:hypothetical protein
MSSVGRFAPPFGERIPDGIELAAHHPRKTLHPIDPGLLGVIEPGSEMLNISASNRPSRAHGEPTHDYEVGRDVLQNLDFVLAFASESREV